MPAKKAGLLTALPLWAWNGRKSRINRLYPDLLTELEQALSAPRLAPYRHSAAGNLKLSILIYLWNSRLAKAYLFPLNVAEITTRNAVHHALAAHFGGPAWIFAPPFNLTPESEISRQRALQRLSPGASPDDLVAALTFDFWSNLFRREYDQLWSTAGLLAHAFPCAPAATTRSSVQALVAPINHLRNRIAHHEPIHTLHHQSEYQTILKLISWRSTTTRDWVRRCSTLMGVVRTPPNSNDSLPGLPLASTNIRPPLVFQRNELLANALPAINAARPPLALVESPGNSAVPVLLRQILSFLTQEASRHGGLVDLFSHDLGTVADQFGIVSARIDIASTTGDALTLFFPSNTSQALRPEVLIVMDGDLVKGVIPHPLIRY